MIKLEQSINFFKYQSLKHVFLNVIFMSGKIWCSWFCKGKFGTNLVYFLDFCTRVSKQENISLFDFFDNNFEVGTFVKGASEIDAQIGFQLNLSRIFGSEGQMDRG